MESLPTISPPQLLALAYAPKQLRPELAVLLEFDNRLKAIAVKVQEPILKQLRLAWWREQLTRAPEIRAKGEPLLARLAECEKEDALLPLLQIVVDAWEILAAIDDDCAQLGVEEAQKMRAEGVFAGYAKIAGADSVRVEEARKSGLIWAQASLGTKPAGSSVRLMRGMKPLNLLLLAADIDSRGGGIVRICKMVRLYWHALTGL